MGGSDLGSELDERFMRRALRAGRAGRPSPNPHVGAVVAQGGELIATGYHRRAGEAHAEVMALTRAGSAARGATLYVTLEPCNHHGRTPPCTEAVIQAGIRRVVIGCKDPDPHVAGATARLKKAGVAVQVGVCEQEAKELVADFRKTRLLGLPFVTLKGAVSLDGRIATGRGESKYITGSAARREGQRMRDRSDAVLVGIGTALADDPLLTVRDIRGRTPLRVVLDTKLRLSKKSQLARTAKEHPCLVYHGPDAPVSKQKALAKLGVSLKQVPLVARKEGVNLRAVLKDLSKRDVVRLMVEGGAHVHGAFLDAGLVDRVAVFVAPLLLADPTALPLALGRRKRRLEDGFRLRRPSVRLLGDDALVEGWIE